MLTLLITYEYFCLFIYHSFRLPMAVKLTYQFFMLTISVLRFVLFCNAFATPIYIFVPFISIVI